MADSAFSLVKAALPAQADAILAEFGIKHHKEGTKLKGDWTTGYLCPLCGDKSGSASFTHQLFLKCHQCATKADVFDWLAKHTGKRPWDLCKELAERLQVKLPTSGKPAAKSARSMPTRMTEAVLQQAIHDLWDNPDAAPARAILAERKLDDQVLLSHLEVGWIKGWIVFISRDENGGLFDRYRGWNPGNPKLRWMWFGSGSGGPGIWPCVSTGPFERVMLLEGESDVLTALARLRLHEQGWRVVTWTAGATSCPQAKDVPRELGGKPLFIGYDNDVFQGPDYENYYVETKPGKDPGHARLAAEQRLRNLLQKVAPLFVSMGCSVSIMQCPVDPREKFGGDFRDWVDQGGRELSDWKTFPFDDLPEYGKLILDLPFSEVFGTLHKLVRTRTQIEAVARDDVILSNLFEMKCEMGLHPACAACPGARQFPDKLIDMTDFQRELAVGLEQQNVSDKIVKDVIQRPKGCPRVEVVPIDVVNGSEWKGMQPGKVHETQKTLHVFSHDPPSLSGEMEIEGIAYPNARGNGLVFLAEKVRQLDKAEVDLAPVLHELLLECPAFSDRIEDIDAFFDRRVRDLSYHVTKIYGRRDIHIAHDLLAHSAHRATLFGATQRAWLDICVFGDTRTGKSLTFRRMIEFHGMGVHHTAVSNISRAGLLMGAGKDGMLKPGMMPRCNKKMMMLDEFHFLVQNNSSEHPMSWMQSARDDGVASGVKIYGNRDLPAAVRLVTVANWMHNKRKIYQFDCEHLGALYGAPETLARLDFALVVNEQPTQLTLDKVPQFWTKERTRALILRAWSQEPNQIIIDDDAADLAKSYCREWQDSFDCEQLPLFTPEEKSYSLQRIAIAVANAVFSHPKNDPYSVHVRKVHVEWAANWLMRTWKLSGYDIYSQRRRESQKIVRIFEAERMFTFSLGLEDPEIAGSRLEQFLTPFGSNEIITLTGLEPMLANNWLSRQVALHVFERVREKNAYTVRYQLTRGGQQLLGNLIRLSEGDVAAWVARYQAIRTWSNAVGEPDLVPMNADSWELFGQTPF